jgi:cytochrome c biogenesis protein CcmG, thiol:disulfide interchange protein DsbE
LLGLAIVACNSDDDRRTGPALKPFLDGGRDAFEAYVKEQRGRPVVANKWASWCGPCRAEFPWLRDQARKRRGKVVFVGVNSQDSDSDARRFLADNPVPFRHFTDPNLEIATLFKAVAFPTTAFYDRRGKLAFVHQGSYPSEAELADDIDRYAR